MVHHCPTWQWASGDESKLKHYLPKDKQFLVTRNGNLLSKLCSTIYIFVCLVPCYKRCKEIEYVEDQEKIIDEDADGGWVDTHHYANLNEQIDEMTLAGGDKLCTGTKKLPVKVEENDEDDDEGEAEDMDAFLASGMIDEEDKVIFGIKN